MVATDGHRLSKIDRQLQAPIPFEKNLIVPRKGLQEIRKVLEDKEGSVQFGILENNCVFKKGQIIIFIRLIEGEFPNYRDVIPPGSNSRANAWGGEL